MMVPAAAVLAAHRVGGVLADPRPGNNTGGQGPDFGKASPIALLVVLVLLAGVFLLVRSMTRHLKRVPASFDNTGDEQGNQAQQPPHEDSESEPDQSDREPDRGAQPPREQHRGG